MQRKLELLRADEGDRVLLRSPDVGRFTCCVPQENLLSPGAPAGTLITLGETVQLVVPAGVIGRIVSARPERVHHPVGYGDVLYQLVPLDTALACTDAQQPSRSESDAAVFRAPHTGRFWQRPAPGDPAFVREGDVLTPGTILGLIEVMKTFTHVTYEGAGSDLPERARVVRFLVVDGGEVTEEAPLLEVEPA